MVARLTQKKPISCKVGLEMSNVMRQNPHTLDSQMIQKKSTWMGSWLGHTSLWSGGLSQAKTPCRLTFLDQPSIQCVSNRAWARVWVQSPSLESWVLSFESKFWVLSLSFESWLQVLSSESEFWVLSWVLSSESGFWVLSLIFESQVLSFKSWVLSPKF